MKDVYKLQPSLHECVWGGDRLAHYGKATLGKKIGESWELSFVKDAEALADGVTLNEAFPKSLWGGACEKFDRFPVLTKFIDAKDKLSVQVHPSDSYALENEGQYGKTEMWYIVDALPGAGIYIGLKEECTPEEFSSAVADGSVEKLLNFQEVKSGEVYFIPSGTIHAIGSGVLIYEIQQNSTLTYRLYDYMRRDKDGNLRPLHVERAMRVASLKPYEPFETDASDPSVIGRCEYFTTRIHKLSGTSLCFKTSDSFIAVSCTRGSGTVGAEPFSAGDSFFMPCGGGRVEFSGECELVSVVVGDGKIM